MPPRLITIPLSHYCERARWALDLCELDYDEVQHLQKFAGQVTRRLGAKHTVPVLIADGVVIDDSRDIVRWASARVDGDPLYAGAPRSEIEALEDELAGEYGVETRRIVYDWFFRQIVPLMPYNAGATPRYQRALLRVSHRVLVPKLRDYLRVHPEKVAAGKDMVRRKMDELAKRLADGRPYLLGDQFTAADLTYASLTWLSVIPPQFPMALPGLEVLDAESRAWIEEMRAHPAGAFALRLYEERPAMRGRLPRPPRVRRSPLVTHAAT